VVPDALVQQAKAREAARLTLEIERVRLRPTLDLVAGITESLVAYTANTAETYGAEVRYVGLRVNWNIFDGYQSEAAVARARADLRQKDLDFDLAAQALQRQLSEGWKDLELAQRELALLEARYAQASARLAADQSRKDAGQIADEDWQQRLFEHEQLHLDVLQARAAQLLRVAEYALLSERGTLPSDRLHFP
jgi:outer membrane protein TolC